MGHSLVFKEEAIQDIAEAFDWYQNKRIGLGVEFLNEVEDFCIRITQNPEQYPKHKDQRIAVLHQFPYKMIFEIEIDVIVIYAVYHDKRDPEKLTTRH
jgi:hypothetical protein